MRNEASKARVLDPLLCEAVCGQDREGFCTANKPCDREPWDYDWFEICVTKVILSTGFSLRVSSLNAGYRTAFVKS